MNCIFDEQFDDIFDNTYDEDVMDIVYKDNIFGGKDVFDDNVLIAHSKANLFGGEDYYDENNQRIAHTEDNGFGGLNIYSNEGYEGALEKNCEGDDIFYGTNGSIEHLKVEEYGNGSAIMQFDDPLAHLSSYIMPSLII